MTGSLSAMVDLLLAGTAAIVLVAVTVVLVRSERRGRGRTGLLAAVIVLAAGTFAIGLYRGLDDGKQTIEVHLPAQTFHFSGEAIPVDPGLASHGFETVVTRVEVPMGTGDKLPQGALWLSPPRAGTDAYTGDLSILCATPGKAENQQNCTGGDRRVWTVEPLAKRAALGPAKGDPFTDPATCRDASYKAEYLEISVDKAYCVRRTGVVASTFAVRVRAFPAERPLPARIVVEVAELGI